MRSKLIPLALSFLPFLPNLTSACQLTTGIKLTNYGFPDASGTPAYKCVNGRPQNTVAGDRTELGDGSIRDPYAAAASANSVFQKCEVFYVPILKKYFRVQDDCSGCGKLLPSPLRASSPCSVPSPTAYSMVSLTWKPLLQSLARQTSI